MTTGTTPAPLVATALRHRCPRCGQGRVYDSYLKVTEHCSECGLALASNDTADGPAVFLLFIVGGIAIPLAFWADAIFGLSSWAFLALSAVLIIGMTLALLPPAKALVLGLQYRHRPEDFDADSGGGDPGG